MNSHIVRASRSASFFILSTAKVSFLCVFAPQIGANKDTIQQNLRKFHRRRHRIYGNCTAGLDFFRGIGYNHACIRKMYMDRYRSGHNGPDSKSGSRASGSWVRIPPYPPHCRSKVRFAPAFLCPNFINLRFRRLSICFQNSRPPAEQALSPSPAPRIFGIVVEMGITVDEGSTGGYVAFN